MDFIDELRALAARIPQQLEHLRTEEGTKHALVMPFIIPFLPDRVVEYQYDGDR